MTPVPAASGPKPAPGNPSSPHLATHSADLGSYWREPLIDPPKETERAPWLAVDTAAGRHPEYPTASMS